MNSLDIKTLFKNGCVSFAEKESGHSWTMTATGDAAPKFIPETSDESSWDNLMQLTNADFSMVNLESALVDEVSKAKGVSSLKEDFSLLRKKLDFDLYCLANNHVMDAGRENLDEMLKDFEVQGTDYIGAGHNLNDARKPFFKRNFNGISIGVLAYAQDEGQVATSEAAGVAPQIKGMVEADAAKLVQECDVPVVIMHEGFEFLDWPRAEFRSLCHRLVDLGVKVIFCHHPHVPQGIEKINDSLIFYSLGNFIFNMPYHDTYKWSKHSFVPRIHFNGKDISKLEIQPFSIISGKKSLSIHLPSGEDRVEIMSHLREISEDLSDVAKLNEKMKWFFCNIHLPEFLGNIRNKMDKNNGHFNEVIEFFKRCEGVHKFFADFGKLYRNDGDSGKEAEFKANDQP